MPKESYKILNQKLQLKNIKLNSLLEITKAINNNYSTSQLIEIYCNVLQNQLNIGKLALYSYDAGWTCLLKYGLDEDYLHINVEEDLLHIREITEADFSTKPHFNSFDVVVPVFHKSMPLAYVLLGDIDEERLEISPTIKHLPFIQTITNIIIVAIENKRFAKYTLAQEGLKKELELASHMQAMLIPDRLPHNEKLDIGVKYKPHQEIGGDYYDFIQINENEVAFCMADVSGKGVPAALLMSNFQAYLRVLFNYTKSLTELVKELNSKVMENTKGEKFITLFVARYNIVTRMLNYINAGHNPPILITKGKVSLLRTGCTGLGMFDDLPRINEGIVSVPVESVLHCYTDGVVEPENEAGIPFGIEGLRSVLINNEENKVDEINIKILQGIDLHRGTKPYVDDIALFTCRIH